MSGSFKNLRRAGLLTAVVGCVLAGCNRLAAQNATQRAAAPGQATTKSPATAAQHRTQPAGPSDQQLDALKRAIESGEPGTRLRALEAFLARYPHPENAEEIYRLLVADSTALNDERRVLLYNEKLQEALPEDMGQRIKTLNLLLLNDDPASVLLAQRYADELLQMAKQKAHETKPSELSAARWQTDLRRLEALAQLLRGTAYYKSSNFAVAESALRNSLELAQTQEAAVHLAKTCQGEHKLPEALDAYAMALALPGGTIAEHASLRSTAGKLYRQLHGGSEAGFGDLILAKFDQVSAKDANARAALQPESPNASARTLSAFSLNSLDGRQHRLEELKGKVVVVDFWATWCGPCEVEHPLLEHLKTKYLGSDQVAFVAINEDEDKQKVVPFLREHRWSDQTWLDDGLGEQLGIDSLPTTLVLTPSGAIDFRLSGVDEASFETQLDAAIQHALHAG